MLRLQLLHLKLQIHMIYFYNPNGKEHPNYHLFQEELDNNQSTNLVIIPNYDPLQTQIDSFGGIIGIKWY